MFGRVFLLAAVLMVAGTMMAEYAEARTWWYGMCDDAKGRGATRWCAVKKNKELCPTECAKAAEKKDDLFSAFYG